MVKIVSSKDPRIPNHATLLAIDNRPIEDFLEFNFYNDVVKHRKILVNLNGRKKEIIFKPDEKIMIKLETPKYRSCENDCDFCFVKGLPRGLRKELYFRDDDYRLSFLFGNFLSLTNITNDDIRRIARLRLSPLYVSVHTTNPALRQKLFKNERAALIMKSLSMLIEHNIKLHCQVVVIPGVTDGESLFRTINDLSKFYPGVASIGVVPVGKTKYLKHITQISIKSARQITKMVNEFHEKFRKKYKCGLVYLADEFFIKCHNPIPEASYYDDFPQQENGIGMVRLFIDEIASLSKIKEISGRNLILTSKLALPFVKMLKSRLEGGGSGKARIDIRAVRNHFFGDSVTVAGLIGALDFSRVMQGLHKRYDRIVLPPNCVNESGKFIDNKIISDKKVIVSPNALGELIKWLQ